MTDGYDNDFEDKKPKFKKRRFVKKGYSNDKTSKIDKIKKYYEKLNEDPEKVSAYIKRKVIEMLAESDKTRFQLEEYIFKRINKEKHESLISSILDDYEDAGYINDDRFIENYIRFKHGASLGKTRILKELKEKGLTNIELINEEFEKYNFEESLIEYVNRKYLSKTNKYTNKEYDKIKRQLITKGFSFGELSAINGLFDISNVIQDNKKEKKVDSEKLLEKLIRKGYGLNKIKQEFKQKGILLEESDYINIDFYEIAKEYKIKKFGEKAPKDQKEKQKEVNHLLGRGFSYDEIKEAYL